MGETVKVTEDEYAPCPDPRCNDKFSEPPMAQCVTAVAWCEEAQAISDILREMSDCFNGVDNGHCTICRQHRLYDTRGNVDLCENADCLSRRVGAILERYEKPSEEVLERMRQRCLEQITAAVVAQRTSGLHTSYIERKRVHGSPYSEIAEAARDFIWEPENWEAYQDSKESNSVAWPPEFLLLAQAVEREFGPMLVGDDIQ